MTGQEIIQKVYISYGRWPVVLLFVVVVDHLRKFVVDKHLEAASHKRNAERKDGGKQQTLKIILKLVYLCPAVDH